MDDLKARLRVEADGLDKMVVACMDLATKCGVDVDALIGPHARSSQSGVLVREAADWIEKLEAENARLRRSLPPVQNPLRRGGSR